VHQYVKFDDDPNKRCATCQHFGHWTPAGYAWCLHGKMVFAMYQTGCGYWVREPGADDDLVPDPDATPPDIVV
jgi:hypothetical protein